MENRIDYIDGSFIINPETNKTLNYFLKSYKQKKVPIIAMKITTASPKLITYLLKAYKWIYRYEKATDIPDDAVLGGRNIDGSLQ